MLVQLVFKGTCFISQKEKKNVYIPASASLRVCCIVPISVRGVVTHCLNFCTSFSIANILPSVL